MFAFLLTLLILDALLLSVVVLLQAGQGGGLASLGGGTHRYGARRPAGGHHADQGHLVVRRHLPGAGAGALARAARRQLERRCRSGSGRPRPPRRRRGAAAARRRPDRSPARRADGRRAGARARRRRRSSRAQPRRQQPSAREPPLPSPAEEVTAIERRGDRMTDRPAFVLLEDGAWFAGTTARPIDPAFGEVVFTTNLTGYQETFTDPSYLGQIVVMTAPMIGNYGVNVEDMESARPQVSGVVVRELSRHSSNWRATRSLDDWLAEAGVPVLEGIDTRRLTRHLRERGAMRGVVAEGRQPSRELTAQLLASPSMEGLDLASRATVRERVHARARGRTSWRTTTA